MKNIILVLPLLIACSNYLFPQWSTDPNNNLIVGYGLDPHICSDSAGGCYVTYDYNSTSYPRWLAVERLDKYGYKPWGTLKRILGETPEQSGAEIIEDGEGGVIVSYIDRFENLPDWTQRVKVQRVDSNGNYLWNQTGVRVTLGEINQGSQYLCTDGDGGCIIVWMDVNYTYYVNRIDNIGNRLWGDNGITLNIGTSYVQPIALRAADENFYIKAGSLVYRIRLNGEIVRSDSVTFESIIADSDGGIVISGRVGNVYNRRLVAQRQDSLGNNLWQEPYVEIADSLDINASLNIKYNVDYFYYCWSGKKNGIDKVVQFQALRFDGTKLFPVGNMQVGKPPLGGAYVVPLEKNKTTFIYHETNYLPDSLLAQVYDTLGNKLWDTSGVLISHPSIEYQSFTTDGNGGFIIGGVINNFTIVAQQVSRNGNLGEVIPVPVELILFTCTADKDKIILNWITATELNNYGFEIEKLQNSKIEILQDWKKIGFVPGYGTTAEPKSYSFTDNEVTTGIYKYRLRQIDFDGTFEYSNEIVIDVDLGKKEFVLYQNYPNPFNPSTNIKCDIPVNGLVTLKVYDVLGSEVATLVNEEKLVGRYEASFDASSLASGVYIYRLSVNDFVNVKKMVLLK